MATYLYAQDSLTLYIDDDTARVGDQVCLPLRVAHFNQVEAMQLSINFDPHLLRFDSTTRLNSSMGIAQTDFSFSQRGQGILRFIYLDGEHQHSLANGESLFDLCFTITGRSGSFCPVNISQHPLEVQIIADGSIVPVQLSQGQIHIINPSNYQSLIHACHTTTNQANGSIEITAYGGEAPYIVLWQNVHNSQYSGGFGLDDAGDSQVITDLIEGRYRFTISDANNNRIIDSINILTRSQLQYVVEVQSPKCDNSVDGEILLDSLSGGVTPLFFKWSDGELITQNRYGLGSGDYILTITDGSGCQTIDSFHLAGLGLVDSLTIDPESCSGAHDGAVSVIPGNGLPDSAGRYTFITNDTTIHAEQFNLGSLSNGSYEVIIEDETGCQNYVHYEIPSLIDIRAEVLDVTKVSCNGVNDGHIFLRIHNAAGVDLSPYTFSWSTMDSIQTDSQSLHAYNLTSGFYSVTVTQSDFPECSWDTTVFVGRVPGFDIITLNTQDESCDPGHDGTARIAIDGGLPPYTYEWTSGQVSDSIVGLTAGNYAVTVTDSLGCMQTGSVQIDRAPGAELAASSISGFRCDSIAAGTIFTLFESDNGIRSYRWNTGDTLPSIHQLTAGQYWVEVTDMAGCVDTFSFDALPSGPFVQINVVQPIVCHGDSNAVLQGISSPNPRPAIRYSWSTGDSVALLDSLGHGMYWFSATDSFGCMSVDTITLADPDRLQLEFDVQPDINHQSIGSIRTVVTGGRPPYFYQWSDQSTGSNLDGLTSGFYTLVITDSTGCYLIDSAYVDNVSATDENESAPQLMRIFPNPTSSILSIDLPLQSSEWIEVSIHDMMGRKYLHQRMKWLASPLTFDDIVWPTGTYGIEVRIDNGDVYHALIQVISSE